MAPSNLHRFSHQAMATQWEFILVHQEAAQASRVAQKLRDLADTLEDELSRFRSGSFISQIARLEPGEPLAVSRACHDCLELAKAVHAETQGAFDATVAELYQGGPRNQWKSGMDALHLDASQWTVWTTRPGVRLDLGAIGKGFALDEMVTLLHEEEIAHALLNAGESTILALGNYPGEEGWPVRMGQQTLALRGQAISGSGFEVKGLHIFDPRTGQPLQTERRRAWVVADSAALSDAVSTAAMIMTEAELEDFAAKHPEITIMIPGRN